MATTTKRKIASARRPKKPIPKRDIAAEIIEGLVEAIRFERGEDTGARFKAAPISARDVHVDPAPQFGPKAIAGLRSKLGLTQPVFAGVLNVSPETVKAWEQGKFPPQGAANRLLELADKDPSILLSAIRVYKLPVAPQLKVAERRP